MGEDMTRAEAEADMRDDRTEYEKALDLNAFACQGENGQPSVSYGRYPFSGFLVNSHEVAVAAATLLNQADPSTIHLLMPILLQAYHQKMQSIEALPYWAHPDYEDPELDDENPPDYEDDLPF